MYKTTTLLGETFSFPSLKEIMAKANEERSGDELAGISAGSMKERMAAKQVLADLTLSEIRITCRLVPMKTTYPHSLKTRSRRRL